MSYYICVSAHKGTNALINHFNGPFEVVLSNSLPIGREMVARRPNDVSALILSAGCSTNLLNRGPKKQQLATEFLSSLELVLAERNYVSLLLHFMRKDIRREKVDIKSKIKISMDAFRIAFPNKIEEDSKYILLR